MRREIRRADNFTKLICPKREFTCCSNLRVFLTQTSGACIARIRRHCFRFLSVSHTLFVFTQLCITKFFERFDRHINLAAHFKHARHGCARFRDQLFRYHTDRAHICSHIFTDFSVATCCRLNEFAIFITNAQRQTVNLQLTRKLHRNIVKALGRALAPRLQLSDIHCIVKTRHRHAMRHRVKRRCTCTNCLSRRRVISQLWIFRLELG